MSIASRITAITGHITDIYDTMALGGDTTSNKNIVNINTEIKREYKDFLKNGVDTLWNNWEKVSGEGTELSLNNTMEAKMKVDLKGNTQQGNLPSGYTQVDYIESSGTQYINTGYKVSNKTQVEAKLYTTEAGNKNWFGGSANIPDAFVFNSFSLNKIEYRYGNDNNWTNVETQNNVVNRIFTVRFGNGILDIDNVNYKQLSTTTFQDTLNLTLFVRNNGTAYISGRIYYLKIYEDNVLLKNLIPCYRNSDNAVGLYDLVSNTFYGNNGTGTFTYGSIAPTPDTPIPVQVVSGDNTIKVEGKNLLNNSTFEKGRLDNGVVGYASDTTNLQTTDNSITFTTNANWRGVVSDYIKITPGETYTFNCNNDGNMILNVDGYDINKNWLSRISANTIGGNISKEITETTNVYYLRISFQLPTGSTRTLSNLMLYKGTTATTYTPYVSQTYPISLGNIELCKIGTYQDYIYKTDKWYLHKEITKWKVNSLGTWNYDASGKRFSHSWDLTNRSSLAYCNYLERGDTWNKNNRFGVSRYTMYLSNWDYDNTTDLKNWLDSINLFVYYVSQTPTNVEITDSTLLGQLNALESATSYDGTTNISQTNDDMPFILDITALKDM